MKGVRSTPESKTEVDSSAACARGVVTAMYDAINDRNADKAIQYIDDNCVYEDLNFPEPKVGKAQVEELFRKSCEDIPKGMDFVVDEITGDNTSCGVVWHVEILGKVFPNTRGCSFYKISPESGKLVYARDVVESPLKPGEGAFALMKVLVPLYLKIEGGNDEADETKMDTLSEDEFSETNPWAGRFLWSVAAAYVSWLILSPPNLLAPGEPIWAIRPETLKEVVDESINFFYVDILLDQLGVSPLPSPVCNPVSEALFNFVNAWSFMYLPLLLADKKSDGLPKIAFWSVQMFLTNAILTPFLALRATNVPEKRTTVDGSSSFLRKSFGVTGSIVGIVSLGWLFFARPEYGAAADRIPTLVELLSHDRVAFAFGVDCFLYSVYQSKLLSSVDPEDASPLKHVPFVGLVRWLLK